MKTLKPKFQTRDLHDSNYGPAYIGFSYRDNNAFSQGIAYFTAPEEKKIKISHSFLQVDEHRIIEASIHGVVLTELQPYIDDPHVIVFYKKPRALTPKRVDDIIFRAMLHIGQKYDYSLFGEFLYKFLLLKFIGRLPGCGKNPSWFNTPNEWVCSEVVADALLAVEEYSNLVPLSELHTSKINPVDLFRSPIMEPWSFD